jgi:hypothetical protein
MPWTAASAISCWRSLWRRQNFVWERKRIQTSTRTLVSEWSLPWTTLTQRVITTVMICYFMILSVKCTPTHQTPLDFLVLSWCHNLHPIQTRCFFSFISVMGWKTSAFLWKVMQRVLRLSSLLCGVEFKVLIEMKALFIINHDTTQL